MDCQVCFLPYNTSSRMPKTLLCGHTFCIECLNKLKDDVDSTIRCPKDRKTSAIPQGGITELMTNFAVLYMCSDDCVDCHEKTQDGQCVPEHCSKLLCSDCKTAHLKEFSQELITELDGMREQMTKQQAMCDDNTYLKKMMDQATAAITEINRVFDAEKERMIKAIRGKLETDGNDYFEWKGNFDVCLAKGRSFLNKVMSEIMFRVDSLSGKYLSQLKKQIISEKEAICEVEQGKSQFSSFDASGLQQEFNWFMPAIYNLVMPTNRATTMAPGATAAERKQDVKQTGATTMALGATAAQTKQATLFPTAGPGAGESSLLSRVAISPVSAFGQQQQSSTGGLFSETQTQSGGLFGTSITKSLLGTTTTASTTATPAFRGLGNIGTPSLSVLQTAQNNKTLFGAPTGTQFGTTAQKTSADGGFRGLCTTGGYGTNTQNQASDGICDQPKPAFGSLTSSTGLTVSQNNALGSGGLFPFSFGQTHPQGFDSASNGEAGESSQGESHSSAGESLSGEEEEEYEDEDEVMDPMFSKRATLCYVIDKNVAVETGMGDLQVIYDEDVFGARIRMTTDADKMICNHIVCRRYTVITNEKKKTCEWTAKDFSTDEPVKRTFRAQFSSANAVQEFQRVFQQGLEWAQESEIDEVTDGASVTGN